MAPLFAFLRLPPERSQGRLTPCSGPSRFIASWDSGET